MEQTTGGGGAAVAASGVLVCGVVNVDGRGVACICSGCSDGLLVLLAPTGVGCVFFAGLLPIATAAECSLCLSVFTSAYSCSDPALLYSASFSWRNITGSRSNHLSVGWGFCDCSSWAIKERILARIVVCSGLCHGWLVVAGHINIGVEVGGIATDGCGSGSGDTSCAGCACAEDCKLNNLDTSLVAVDVLGRAGALLPSGKLSLSTNGPPTTSCNRRCRVLRSIYISKLSAR